LSLLPHPILTLHLYTLSLHDALPILFIYIPCNFAFFWIVDNYAIVFSNNVTVTYLYLLIRKITHFNISLFFINSFKLLRFTRTRLSFWRVVVILVMIPYF